MSKICYEHGRTRSKGPFSAANTCTIGVSRPWPGHGKSPCFSRSRVLSVANLEQAGLVLRVVNIRNCLERA